MDELLNKMEADFASFLDDARKNVSGNKQAGRRARPKSTQLGKDLKKFRDFSNGKS